MGPAEEQEAGPCFFFVSSRSSMLCLKDISMLLKYVDTLVDTFSETCIIRKNNSLESLCEIKAFCMVRPVRFERMAFRVGV